MRTQKSKRVYGRFFLIPVLIVLLASLMPLAARADTFNPGVLSPDSPHYGATYGEWSARWWQWALAQPIEVNPLLDSTGEHCQEGQFGSVWFLAGTFTGSATRSCTIPADTALFFPVGNQLCLATKVNETADKMQECARRGMRHLLNKYKVLTAEIDGVPIEQLEQYRVASPIFEVTLPESNVTGLPAGTYGPAAADGIYLLISPLSAGEHVIHFSVNGFLDVTYNLTVESNNSTNEATSIAPTSTAKELPVSLFLPFARSSENISASPIEEPCPLSVPLWLGSEPYLRICG
jgi:hypothetical protein